MTPDEQYIIQRKQQAERLSALFVFMRGFPINNNKICFAAYEGDGGFGCNPRYIAKELHRRNPGWKWFG